ASPCDLGDIRSRGPEAGWGQAARARRRPPALSMHTGPGQRLGALSVAGARRHASALQERAPQPARRARRQFIRSRLKRWSCAMRSKQLVLASLLVLTFAAPALAQQKQTVPAKEIEDIAKNGACIEDQLAKIQNVSSIAAGIGYTFVMKRGQH